MSYWRSLLLILFLGGLTWFALSDARVATWEAARGLFEWLEASLFGRIGKTWGAAFALVQAMHLLGMALLGGAVLVGDAQLLGLGFAGQPRAAFQAQAQRLFLAGLSVSLLSGVFMACGVAMKIYYLDVYWYKMLALGLGIAFAFAIRRPLLAAVADHEHPLVLRLVAVASLMLWFSVAATGRWIGFSG